MNVIGEVQASLRSMGFGPLLLAMLFLASYPLAIGSFATRTARLRCQAGALASVGGFAVLAPSWVHAAVIAAVGVAGIGAFVLLTWLLSRLLGVAERRDAAALDDVPAEAGGAGEAVPVNAPAVEGRALRPQPVRVT